MIEPQTSQVNIPPTTSSGGLWGKIKRALGPIGGGLGAIAGSFVGQPLAGFKAGSAIGGTIGAVAPGGNPKYEENKPTGGEMTPMVRALKQDPQAQNYALELGKQGMPQDDPRYAYITTAQQKLKEKWGMQ